MNAVPPKKAKIEAQQSLYADRVRVYPKSVDGPVRRIKWAILCFCLGVYYILPWLRWHRGPGQPSQALLLDIVNRRFYMFGAEFWPQDIYLLTGLLILSAVSLFLVTSMFGRVWCGYACPQTVWTDLFMLVERWIEGDRNARIKLDHGPMSLDKFARKAAKHLVWLGIAFWTGGAWIMYYIDAPTLVVKFWTGRESFGVYGFIGMFTATTYVLAGWAREQVCTYMCPWPRFQAAMLDEQSLIVTYQDQRGEPRGHGKRPDEFMGDCVDCGVCVAVCPTGIDIRDGVQLECINCGLCVDGCDSVMEKLGMKSRLIGWDTLADQQLHRLGQAAEKPHYLRPRTIIYTAALAVAFGAMMVGFFARPTLAVEAQHDRAPLFVMTRDGGIRNAYTLKLTNRLEPTEFSLNVEDLPGAMMSVSESGVAPAPDLTLDGPGDEDTAYRVLIHVLNPQLNDGSRKFTFVLKNLSTGKIAHYQSVFLGPGYQE
jgi:cytochrome c oxidase accessory protein FixG